MRKKLFEVSLVTISVFLFVALLVSQPMVLPFIIGGVITSGILGGFSGKVGPVVGGNWKGIDFMRSYVIPANPNSVNQQTQRTKFTVAIDLARQILGNIIQPYWDQYQTGKSGFNACVSEFLNTLDGSNMLVVGTSLAKGTLEGLGTLTATYNNGTGAVSVSWTNDTPSGNGLGSDDVKVLIYNKTTNTFYVISATAERTAGILDDSIVSGLTATNLIAYAFAIQGTGSEQLVSDSAGDVCAAP